MGMIKDASLLQTLLSQLTQVNVRVMQDPLSDIQYPNLVPVNTSYAEGQPSAMSLNFDNGVGKAQWISGGAKDVPMVDLGASGTQYNFAMFALGWEINAEEQLHLQYANFSLSDAKARVVRRKAEEFVESYAMTGLDPDGSNYKGWTGIVNKTGVTIVPASTKAAGGTQWVNVADGTLNATPQEIAADVLNAILGPTSISNSVRPIAADTLALPSAAYRALATTFTDALNGSISFLEWIQRSVQGVPGGSTFQIVEIPELATAATTVIVGGGRAIAYRRSLDVLELPMPMPFRFLNEYRDGPFNIAVPGWGKFGEVQIHQSRGFRYLDGIQTAPA